MLSSRGRVFRLVDCQMGRLRPTRSRIEVPAGRPGESSTTQWTTAFLGYLIAISIGTAFLFGLAPALRLSKLDVNTALKDGGRGAAGGGRGKHLSALLVIGEMALAVVLLAGAGVMIRSFLNIYNADLGVEQQTSSRCRRPACDEISRRRGADLFYDRLKARLQAIPGVESVALAGRLPRTAHGASRTSLPARRPSTSSAARSFRRWSSARPTSGRWERRSSPAVSSMTPMELQEFR